MREARDRDERVVVMGDSSGGNLALSLVTWAATSPAYQAQAAGFPVAVLVISPATDLRHADPDIRRVARKDPVLTPSHIQSTARAWSQGDTTTTGSPQPGPEMKRRRSMSTYTADDASVSPALANLEPLARWGIRVHGVTGTYDVLNPEAVAFREKLREAGVAGEWLEWDRQMHCFPLAFGYGLNESVKAVDYIVDILIRA
ncbi:Alpha/Beta hydrolase protein [Stachybotrys elegans]|uniref:Alpha/Beta hydrolase protein n=1 Tax=Stachybotrys elegans TaxID=80388 RepID=A0A8K0SJZ8_9HYPO|nr:Alpha/Beta hydrolase protein [Stachybotrys elegans]